MKKKLASKIMKLWKNNFVKIVVYSVIVLVLMWISKKTNNEEISLIEKIKAIVLKEETMSFFLAGLFTLIVAYTVKTIGVRTEENLKIEADHHKIISKYSAHSKDIISKEDNFFSNKGNYMRIHRVKKYESKRKLTNSVVGANQQRKEILEYLEEGVLLLPTVNIFTNVKGNTNISIVDTLEERKIPQFVVDNGLKFLMAHKYSNKSNNVTISLNDIDYKGGTLNLYTSRTTYFHMLLTNRCMDYKLDDLVSVRDLYEFNNRINNLKDSKLSNQIGINGVIITKDGYLLLEKRDRKKTTWKNKFAQPISLALKESDLKLDDSRLMKDDVEYANEKLLGIIKKTIQSNFGLTQDDYESLDIKNNFLGIARDLLEGGKPNMYFVVTLKDTARELLKKLKSNAMKIGEGEIKKEKLLSQYYLIPYNEIKIDYNYVLEVNKDKIFKVERIVSPRFKKIHQKWDLFSYNIAKKFKKKFSRECGEALLVTLSYLEICSSRIDVIKKGDEKDEK